MLAVAGYATPRAVFFDVDFRGNSTGAVLGQVIALAVEARGDSTGAVLGQVVTCPLLCLVPMARQRRKPVDFPQVQFLDKLFMRVVVSGADGLTAQKTVDFLQLLFIDCRRQPGPGAVQQTMVFPQLHFLYEVIDVLGMQVVQVRRCVQRHVPSTLAVHQQGRHLPFRGAKAVSHGLSVQADHRDSLLLYMVVDVPVALVVHIPCRGAETDSHGPDCSSDHR